MKTKNRIEEKFKKLKKAKKKAFVVYIMAGDPNIEATRKLVLGLDKIGVDIVELGVPFSDPLADGPTIQAASQRALKNKINLDNIFNLVKRIRKSSQIPLALMTYYNLVFKYGESGFLQKAKQSGVDGIIIPDLIPEEAGNIIGCAKKLKLSTIFFLAPTSSNKRIKLVSKLSSGFIYYVSLTGVTGARKKLSSDLSLKLKKIKRLTKKPVCVGFGISKVSQVKQASRISDGVIVGSAIVKNIQNNIKRKDLADRVLRLVSRLKSPLK